MDDGYDNLQCTICLQFPASPVKSCESLHIVCGCCFDEIKNCGACKKPLIPCEYVDRIAKNKKIRMQCKHSEEGCEELVLSTRMKEHLNHECQFRKISCPFNDFEHCEEDSIVFFKDLIEHLEDEHDLAIEHYHGNRRGKFILTNTDVEDVFTNHTTYKIIIKEFDDNTFLLHRVMEYDNEDDENGQVVMWASILGDSNLAQKYRFIWNPPGLQSLSSEQAICSWDLPVTPIESSVTTMSDAVNNSQAAMANAKAVEGLDRNSASSDNSYYHPIEHVEIRKIKKANLTTVNKRLNSLAQKEFNLRKALTDNISLVLLRYIGGIYQVLPLRIQQRLNYFISRKFPRMYHKLFTGVFLYNRWRGRN